VLYNAYNNRNVSTVTAAREASRKEQLTIWKMADEI